MARELACLTYALAVAAVCGYAAWREARNG